MTSALASLTATYTDSEGEEDGNDEHINSNNEAAGSTTAGSAAKTPSGSISEKSNTSTPPGSPVVKVTSKVAKLVSYHDDTIASDDEDGDLELPQHEVIMVTTEDKKVEELEVVEEDGITIPPEPAGHCSKELQEKIQKLHDKMQTQQMDMNAVIQKRKDFRNPSIYEKLITFCDLNELGTNYPPSIYDPLKWNKESYYEELAKVQKNEMDRREKEQKNKIEFISGGLKKAEDEKKRKSKWDMPGGGGATDIAIKPAGLVQPSLTSSATGTKSTVISAFGSLPKKPRA